MCWEDIWGSQRRKVGMGVAKIVVCLYVISTNKYKVFKGEKNEAQSKQRLPRV